jgi:predicted Zn-dependent protease with MMP-like domain
MSKRQRGQRSHPARRPRSRSRAGDRFEAVVDRVLDSLPPSLEPALSEVAVVVEDWPSREQLGDQGLDEDDAIYGLYEGTPRTEWGADWSTFPNKITIFRGPLQEDFPHQADLEREIRLTIEHELAHHFGPDDHYEDDEDWDDEDDDEDDHRHGDRDVVSESLGDGLLTRIRRSLFGTGRPS